MKLGHMVDVDNVIQCDLSYDQTFSCSLRPVLFSIFKLSVMYSSHSALASLGFCIIRISTGCIVRLDYSAKM